MKPATPQEGGSLRCLLVRAGDYLCAVPVASVRRVVRALTVHALPGASPELSGLAEFSGEPLPVLDLARLVGAPPGATPSYPVTVVVWAGPPDSHEAVGLAADAALEIAEVSPSSVVGGGGGVVRGEAAVGGRPVRVLDLELLGAAR